MRTEFFLAGRYLKVRRNAVSWITLTSVIGVTLGVAVLMIVLAVMTGFTDLMKSKLIETQSHFQIRNRFGAMRDYTAAVRAIQSCGGTAAPVIQAPVLAQYGRRYLDSRVGILAANEADLAKHLGLDRYILSGQAKLARRHAVISKNMADRWGVGVGDKILLHSANRLTNLVQIKDTGKIEMNPNASAYLPTEFTVSGIYSIGKSDFDRQILFIDLDDAAELMDLPWGAATAVFGWGKDPFDQDELVRSIRAKLPETLALYTWEENNHELLVVLAAEKQMMFFLLIFIVLVAAFSITNTLITSVYQKTREIGVLKALGASDGMVMKVFLFQGLLIGLLGSCFGTLAGYLVILFRNDILRTFSRIAGRDLFPAQFYYFNELPAHIVSGDVIFIVAASILLCTLGAVIPALRAARLDPAKALRYE